MVRVDGTDMVVRGPLDGQLSDTTSILFNRITFLWRQTSVGSDDRCYLLKKFNKATNPDPCRDLFDIFAKPIVIDLLIGFVTT